MVNISVIFMASWNDVILIKTSINQSLLVNKENKNIILLRPNFSNFIKLKSSYIFTFYKDMQNQIGQCIY